MRMSFESKVHFKGNRLRKMDTRELQNEAIPCITVLTTFDALTRTLCPLRGYNSLQLRQILCRLMTMHLSHRVNSFFQKNCDLPLFEDTVSHNLQHQAQPFSQPTANFEKTPFLVNKRHPSFLQNQQMTPSLCLKQTPPSCQSREYNGCISINITSKSLFNNICEAHKQNLVVGSV